jgi:FtsP/CotA-like multicopper oxidase with cupredoxin domain
MGGGMCMHGINGRAYDMRRIDEEVKLGDVEIWEVSGEMMVHPFHIHGVHFEVLSRNGAARACAIRASGTRSWRRSRSSFLYALRSLRWQHPSCITAISSNTRTTG